MNYSKKYLNQIVDVKIDRKLWTKHPKHWFHKIKIQFIL